MDEDRHPLARRSAAPGVAFSVVCHAAILFALVGTSKPPPAVAEDQPVIVTLVAPEPPPPPKIALPPTPEPPKPEPPAAKPLPKKIVVKRPPPPEIEPLPASDAPTHEWLGDSQIAGAATAGSGGGGGGNGCDIARRLQAALRNDRRVQTAVALAPRPSGSAGRAMIVWNGDWVQSQGQEGKGLATVRQAIIWTIAFAPEACRNERVRGLVLISLNESPGSAKVAMGSGAWRWSDLLM